MIRFPEKFKIKVDHETQKVTLSIRVTDEKTDVYLIDRADFRKMIGDFMIQDMEY